MTTPNLAFNGSTISFAGSAVLKVISISAPQEVDEIDVSGANEPWIAEGGQLKQSIDVKVVGGTTLTCGTKGAITGAWNDGSTFPAITSAMLSKASVEGSKNNPISTTLHFVPSTAAVWAE
jgi:hypothetical protein